ncbi:PEP-CTERM sorting domain-containing protein [Massilia sp. NEAU-DD11]|uniref:PEP-CTERM sorting domain-containing protein n=1 Tax=Massilia cellulosiltytica TaxID=2683234 RepID=A0A7X3FUR0_9BURK|nr:NF038120 family PEP-CTERM protein [Telluria cellulosilytica]MVW58358.1 PEP-CTERM sorting domain-containing protein [Telluria cellulosilytica]
MTTNPTSCVSPAQSGLNKLVLGAAAALALLGTAPAMASVVNFESLSPDGIYVDGDTLGEAGYTLQAIDNHGGTSGVVGLLVNGMDPTSCWLGGCPTNNTSHSYLGLNDGGVTIKKDDGGKFSLRRLDFGFVAPFGGLPNFSYGQLLLTGTFANGGTLGYALDFPGLDNNGNPLFDTATLPTGFGYAELTSLTIRACLFDGAGGCTVAPDISDPSIYQAQFAIDNLALAEVPEPGSLALIGLGMGAFLARRRKSAPSSNNA